MLEVLRILARDLVSQHALFFTDGRYHLVHFFWHFLQKPVSILDACRSNRMSLQFNSSSPINQEISVMKNYKDTKQGLEIDSHS